MKSVIGRKQSATDDALWRYVAENIEEYVSRSELLQAVTETVRRIAETTDGKRVAFAWSGGKDSIVLADLCRLAGVNRSVFAHTDLEYPEFLEWCLEHKPENCEVINTKQDISWLVEHSEMLFPKGTDQQKWYQIVQRRAFTEFFFREGLDMLIVGHRKADGNVVGSGGVIKKKSGETRWAPLSNWSHEMILAYIHYNKLELPPIYSWKSGYRCGTHPWPSRMGMKTVEQGFQEVYEINPQIVIEAAKKLESARTFIERKNEK